MVERKEGWKGKGGKDGGMGGRELYLFSYTHMERDIRWTNHVTNTEGIERIKIDRNIVHTLKKKGG